MTMIASLAPIEKAYQKEVALLRDLLECLSLERDNLINLNLEDLWSVMEEKHTVLKSIEETREEIQALIVEREKEQEAHQGIRRLKASFSRKIERLKEEIGARVQENVSFIQDTLGFLNEMISILISGACPEPVYGPARKTGHETSNPIYHREV